MGHVIETLNWFELQQAAFVGCRRQIQALAQGRHHRFGRNEDADKDWGNNVLAAAAEMAVAKYLDAYWTGDDPAGDVASYQVRWTLKAHGRLILHDDSPDDRVFVLATGEAPTITIRGWILASDGKQDRYWETAWRHPCYMVPQADLHPMANLWLGARSA